MGVTKNFLLLLLCYYLLLHEGHSKCPKSYSCRNFTLEFPFTKSSDPDCGLFMVDNCDSEFEHPAILRGATDTSQYLIMGKPSSNKFLLQGATLQLFLRLPQCVTFTNFSRLHSPSVAFTFSPNITFFTCYNQTPNQNIQDYFQTYLRNDCQSSTLYYKIPATHHHAPAIPGNCSLNQLPMKPHEKSTDILQLLTPNFTLEWNVSQQCYDCHNGGGQCSSDSGQRFYCRTGPKNISVNEFTILEKIDRNKFLFRTIYLNNRSCLLIKNLTVPSTKSFYGYMRIKKIIVIGCTTIAALASTLAILFVLIRRKRAMAKQEHEKDIELFLKNNGNLAPMRYKYSTIKKMTKSFSENLGRGGFGSVYKGQLCDGHLVAVKVLNETNGNREDFMNEVASISRTSHINIVALLGFCFEGSKRALVYDFMPNGSLEKFIGNNDAKSVLEWDKLFEIALGIARGLEYLHQGCNTRILHLDIKPQNILLDKDLNPRISDFGLAKLCPNRSSIVSMMVARGTIGYIAPEVFSRNFGEVSYKSDVYSYGMLVLEMVGGRRNVDRGDVERTSEIYFPHYIYKQLDREDADRDSDLVGTMHGDESPVVKRNLMIVGLWCIQTNPKDRPSMTKVVEMLEGKLGSLEVPPKPYLYSPPRSAPSFSCSES